MDNREREICPACDWVYYAQLKVGAAVLIEQDGRLLLLRRNHEPWKGTWMVPAGYVEADENPRIAAVREVREETGLEVVVGDLHQVFYFDDDPRGNGVSFVYKAEEIFGEINLNNESTEARFFRWNEIPSELTLGGHNKMIAEWCAQRQAFEFRNV